MATGDNALNLQILQRVDPEVDQVLETAGHVCLYYMHVATQTWTRKNVEGSLFLLKRKKNPRFQMMVLNKLATDNYIETIHGSFDFEVNAPYLMYTHGNSEIHGIWFYEEADLHRLSALLNRVKAGLPKPDILPDGDASPPQQAEPSASSQPDSAFWDKQVVVTPGSAVPLKPEMQAAQQQQQQQQSNLTSLLRSANEKAQQQQQQPPLSPPLLPPSFFGGQAGTSGGAQQPAQPSGTPAASNGNALQKLFAKASTSQQLTPTQPPPPQQQRQQQQALPPQQTPPQQQQQQPSPANPLSKLFAPLPPPSAGGPAPPPGAVPPAVVRGKVRAAFTRLLSNDAFVDMLTAEFRAAGLMAD